MKITDLFAPFPDELQLAPTKAVANPPLVEWTSAFGDLFFRPKAADPQILWCVLGRAAPARPSKRRLETLNQYASRAYAGRTFFRVVPFGDGDDWALVRPKRALVKSPLQRKGAVWQWSADFPVEGTQLEWLSQSLSWLENWLLDARALQEPREFARLNDDERMWLPLCRDPETREKWQLLLPALQKLSAEVVNKNSFICDFREYAKKDGQLPFGTLYRYYSAVRGNAILELISCLQKPYPLDFQISWWRGIGVRGKKQFSPAPTFQATAPSQHETLEAALLWRDFGRATGETARVEAALNQLLAPTAPA